MLWNMAAVATVTAARASTLLKLWSPISIFCKSRCYHHCRSMVSSSRPSYPLLRHSIYKDKAPLMSPPLFCTNSAADVIPAVGEVISSPASADASSDSDQLEREKVKKKEEAKIIDAANMLDIRVGRIIKAWRHEEADSLYVEEVDVGESEPRIICSGLVKYIPLDQLQDRNVVVLANLKPRNMRGVKSSGMLMAASDSPHENVELLLPPEGSLTGERIWFGSEDDKENQPAAALPNQIQKKKIWETVQPHLKTDASCIAMLEGVHAMRTSAGFVTSQSLKEANIS